MSDLADRLEELTKDISREWGNPDKAKLLREKLMHEVWGGREAIIAALRFAEQNPPEQVEEIPMWGAFRPDGSLAFAMPSEDLAWSHLLDRVGIYLTREAAEKTGWSCKKITFTAARKAVEALEEKR